MNEPIKTEPNPAGTGRPIISEEQYQTWLQEMSQFLRQGSSLWYSMDKTNLIKYKDSIYEKYRLKDWFSEKVDALRSTLGELANNIVFKKVERIHARMIESADIEIGDNDLKVLKMVVDKHRSAQPFFVNRTETAEAKDDQLGKIIETMDKSDYDQLAKEVEQQTVADDPSVQDKGQVGPTDHVQAEQNTTQASS